MPSRADPIWYYLDAKAFFENSTILSPYIQDESVSKIGGVGAHGPGYAIFYGLIAKIFGFNDQLIIWVNLFLIASLILLLMNSKYLERSLKFILITIQLSYFSTLWNSFAFTPEIIHIFLANILGLQMIAFAQIKDEKQVNKRIFLFIGIIVLASFFRYSWVLSMVGILAFARKRNDFLKFSLLIFFSLALGYIYLKLFHATYYGLVLGNCSDFLKQGQVFSCLNIIYKNVEMNIPMFFYKYYYANYYFLTKIIFVFSLAFLFKTWLKTKDNLILSTILIQLVYFLSLFLFYDAYDTRDIRGLTPCLIIALIILAFYKKKLVLSSIAIAFLFVFPNSYKDFKYKILDLSLESGRIFKQFDLSVLQRLESRGSSVITVLVPERFYWTPMPNRNPLTIKDILHTKSLALPLKNYLGIPIRYTVNTSAFHPYYIHRKIKVDYAIDLNTNNVIAI